MPVRPAPETFAEVVSDWKVIAAETVSAIGGMEWWIEIGIIALAVALALLVTSLLHRWKNYTAFLQAVTGRLSFDGSGFLLVFPVVASILLWVAFHLAEFYFDRHCLTLRAFAFLGVASVAFLIVFRFFRHRLGAQILFVGLFIWSILYVTKLSGPVDAGLESLAITKGDLRLSLREVLLGFGVLYLFLWIAGVLFRFLDLRVSQSSKLSPSTKVLVQKVLYFLIYGVAILAGLELIGVNLASLAFFGGALGIGIGFGLQKIIANFISGIIILAEKSIKPGDIIEVGDHFGEVMSLRTRYAAVKTLDSKEHLIPNEDLITQTVVSLSHTTDDVGLHLPIGIAYGSDVPAVMDLCVETMKSVPRVSREVGPYCFLAGFGDSSIDLILSFSIADPRNGTLGVKSDVLKAIWIAFQKHDIAIPFPQREVRLLSDDETLS